MALKVTPATARLIVDLTHPFALLNGAKTAAPQIAALATAIVLEDPWCAALLGACFVRTPVIRLPRRLNST